MRGISTMTESLNGTDILSLQDAKWRVQWRIESRKVGAPDLRPRGHEGSADRDADGPEEIPKQGEERCGIALHLPRHRRIGGGADRHEQKRKARGLGSAHHHECAE